MICTKSSIISHQHPAQVFRQVSVPVIHQHGASLRKPTFSPDPNSRVSRQEQRGRGKSTNTDPNPLILHPLSTCSHPTQPDMFDELASEMCHVHNMINRGLNSIYLQAPHITPTDEKPFCKYVLGWYNLLHSHHSGEERDFFPTVEKMTGVKGIMDNNIDQHKAFHDGMDSLKAFADGVLADEQKYDGSRLVALIDSFGPALMQHLADEIPTILSLRQYGDKMAELPKAFDEEGEKAMVR
jgi:hypothetical protein